jgi:hypothetical protein
MKKFLAVVLEMTMNPLAKITFSCKRMARHGIAFPFRAVIGLAALSLLNCVALGQPFSGPGVFSGNTQFGGPVGGGAPLTYSAVTDQCELGTETYCTSGLPLPFLYCNTGAYSAGSTFTPVNTTPCPVTNGGTAPNIGGLTGAGTIITEPYFNSKVVRVTDYGTQSGSPACDGGIYDNFSTGQNNGWTADSSKFVLESVGGVKCVFAFSADSSLTAAPSSISGTSGTACSANCTHFLTGASVAFSGANPNEMVELSNGTGAINSLIISACSPSIGTCTTNVAPTVANAANWVFSRTLIFNFLTGCSGGPCGLPSAFVPNWNGTLNASNDDSTISFVLSDDGQNSPNWSDGTHMCPQPAGTTVTKYGPSFIFAYKIGAGWRTYNTCGLLGINGDAPYIQGSFGDTGSPTDGTCSSGCAPDGMQPVGTSGGAAITDFMSLHDGEATPDYHYYSLSAIVSDSALPGSCGGKICVNQPYSWEIATTNMRYGTCNAHHIAGSKYLYGGHYYTACSYHNPNSTTPPNGLNLLATGSAIDEHGFSNNMGTQDYQPGGASTTQVCDQNGTPGGSPTGTFPAGACKTYATNPWWNEIIMVENSIGNYTNAANAYGKHCNYGHGANGDACVYRMGQHYNTGTSPYFSPQSAIANNDPTGRYALFVSDWWLTLGCGNGVSSGCLDPVSAGNSATTPTISAVAVDSAGTVATITVANTSPKISTGMYPSFAGLGNATFLNGNFYFVTSFSGTQFTVCAEASGGAGVCTVGGIGHASYSGSETTGTAVWGSCSTKYLYASCPRSDLFVMDLVSAHSGPAWAGILDPARAIDWTGAGVVDGIPSAAWSPCGSTIPAGTAAATINAALASCAPYHYVLLGAGTFNLSAYIHWSVDNVVLRGSGPTQTHLVFANGAAGACGEGNASSICGIGTSENDSVNFVNAASWTAGYSRGSTSITISANTTGSTKPAIGMTLILDQLTDGTTRAADTGNVFNCSTAPACTQANGGNGRSGRNQQQTVTVTSISAGSCPCTVGISPGLYMPNWRSGQTPQAWWANGPYQTGWGLEDLSIDTSLTVNNGTGPLAAIELFNVNNSWIKNVSSDRELSSGSQVPNTQRHVRLYQSHNITIRNSYFKGRAGYDDYGVDFWESSDNLIENNIIQGIGTPLNHENGNGNVIGYNFTINNDWGNYAFCSPPTGPCWGQGSAYGHGTHEDFSLFEGNIGHGLEFENYFGQGFFITNFRNRWTGIERSQTMQTVPAFIYGLNRYFNIVGNVLGTSGYHTTYQTLAGGSTANCVTSVYAIGLGGNCGNGDGTTWPLNDTLVTNTATATLMRWGNYDTANAATRFVSGEVPSGISPYPNPVPANNNLPPSFYLSSNPSWFGSVPWPPIGPDVTGGNIANVGGHAYKNPAQLCYESLGGVADGTGPWLTSFNAATCYPSAAFMVPGSLNFGNQVVGTSSAAQTVTLTNNTSSLLHISSIAVPLPYSRTTTCGSNTSSHAAEIPAQLCYINTAKDASGFLTAFDAAVRYTTDP